MTTATIYETYRANRAKGYPPRAALDAAKYAKSYRLDSSDFDQYNARGEDFAVIEIDGFTVKVEIVMDEQTSVFDSDMMGTWKERPYNYSRDYYRHENDEGVKPPFYYRADTRHGFLYGDMTKEFAAELAYFKRAGNSKSVAWDRARASVERMVDLVGSYLNESWYYVGINVTVTRTGVCGHTHEYGFSSVWGCDFDYAKFRQKDYYLHDYIDNCIDEAMDMAMDAYAKEMDR